jgi:hypothetical protein
MNMAKLKKPRRAKPLARKEFNTLEETCWKELTAEWRGLNAKALVRRGACGSWSIKDVMNHIAAWQEATVEILPILLRNRKIPAGQFALETFNQKHCREDAKRSLAASRRRLSRSRKVLLAFLRKVPEKRLIDLKGQVGLWAKYSTYGHYDEHLFDVREFRARTERRK